MNKKWVILCLLFIASQAFSKGKGEFPINLGNSKLNTDDWRIGKFSDRDDEFLFSFGLHGGISFGDDINRTNPVFSGINLEVERILNKRWGVGFKVAPSIHIKGPDEITYYYGLLNGNFEEYQYIFEYSNFYSIPVFLTLKYYFSTGFVRPFFGLDAGIIMILGSIDGTKFLNTDKDKPSFNTSFGVSPRAGIMFDISMNTRFAFDIFCTYATAPKIEGRELVGMDAVYFDLNYDFSPIWEEYTKKLSPSISLGAQFRLSVSF